MASRPLKVAAILVAVAALLVFLVGFAAWLTGARAAPGARAAFEGRWGSLELASFQPEEVTEEDNAATWLLAGSSALVFDREESRIIDPAAYRPASDWSAKERALVSEVATRNSEAFATLERAVALDRCNWGIEYVQSRGPEVPDLLELVWASRLLLADARLRLDQGDHETCLARVRVLGRMASSLESESVLIAGLIGLVIERMQLVLAADMVADPTLPPSIREACANSLLTVDLTEAGQRMLRYHVAWSAPMWSEITLDEQMGPLRSILYHLLYGQVARTLYRENQHWMALFEIPYGSATELFAEPERPPWWNIPAKLASVSQPDIGPMIVQFQSIDALRVRLQAALELRRHASSVGSFPMDAEGIAALQVPEAMTGRSIGYQRTPDGSVVLSIVDGVELVGPLMANTVTLSLEDLILRPAGV